MFSRLTTGCDSPGCYQGRRDDKTVSNVPSSLEELLFLIVLRTYYSNNCHYLWTAIPFGGQSTQILSRLSPHKGHHYESQENIYTNQSDKKPHAYYMHYYCRSTSENNKKQTKDFIYAWLLVPQLRRSPTSRKYVGEKCATPNSKPYTRHPSPNCNLHRGHVWLLSGTTYFCLLRLRTSGPLHFNKKLTF